MKNANLAITDTNLQKSQLMFTSSKRRRSEIRAAERLSCKEIQALQLSSDLTSVADIAERVAVKRGRPVRLIGFSLAQHGVFGLSVALEHEDVVLYERDTTTAHQAHIIGHELGHIVLNHLGEFAAIPLTKHLSDRLVGRVLCRGSTNNQQEIEAEVFADLLHHSMRQSPQERETDVLARRAGGALGLGD